MNRTFNFKLTGVSPLLMHQDSLAGSDQVSAWIKDSKNKGKSKAGDDRTPAWTWISYCYNDDQHIAIPESVVRAVLREAGKKVLTGYKQETFKSYTQSGIVFLDAYLRFTVGGQQIPWEPIAKLEGLYAEHVEAVRKMGFILFAKRAKVGTKKHVRVRPRFDDWAVEGRIVVTEDMLTLPVLTNIFEVAGTYCGLCDWRPGAPAPGPYGRFISTLKEQK